ncbi:Phosphopantetheine adenylyltransferase [hydrothermal vent metagenome]|uniref:Phosphopantetheine adenylyltransferase n=1 Tax=hydrothermal vent metagenome TaxID=652676 RepID=A0A1W1CCB8_9ZZZZ
MKTAVYPGSFDPITNGHIDLIHRATKLFEVVIIAIAQNHNKKIFFPIEKRAEIIRKIFKNNPRVKVLIFDNLLVDFVKQQQANVIIRGLRAVSDFEYEFQLAGMNRKLNENIETLFMTPAEEYANISSSLIREVIALKGDIRQFVPIEVIQEIS